MKKLKSCQTTVNSAELPLIYVTSQDCKITSLGRRAAAALGTQVVTRTFTLTYVFLK